MNRPYIIFIGILTASLAVSAVLSLPPRAAGTSPSGNVTLRLGSKNVAVSVLQKNLIEKGYLTINAPTGYFGPLTAAAMKALQKAKGFPQTGMITIPSSSIATFFASAAPSSTTAAAIGAQPQTTSLQKFLIDRGYLKIKAPTGYFGPLTAAAMKAFQKASGLPQTGAADPATFKAMNGKKQ